MKKIYLHLTIVFIAIFCAQSSIASTVYLNGRYQDANTQKLVGISADIKIPETLDENELYVSNEGIKKTLLVIELAKTMKETLEKYDGTSCEPTPTIDPRMSQHNSLRRKQPPVKIPQPCEKKNNVEIAEILMGKTASLEEDLKKFSDEKVVEVIAVAKKLAQNIMEDKPRRSYRHLGPVRHIGNMPKGGSILKSMISLGGGINKMASFAAAPSAAPLAASAGLNLTGGGVKDFNFFKKTVNDGYVPNATDLIIEGFLSEFDLSLPTDKVCDKLICFNPAAAIDKSKGKLYVQAGMTSNVDKATFSRKPLNLSIVLDISGSMWATDNTDKSRLAWAKEAIEHTVNQLNESDVVSIVLFDRKSEILLHPLNASEANKELILEKVRSIKTKGSTNLYDGLKDGYKLVSKDLRDDYENRVILISDAGLNTGFTDHDQILRLITDGAGENIGLTAIGVGENYNQNLIHTVTMSKGGNAIFAQSGKEMMKHFKGFDFLVTPVAYNFKASITLKGLAAKIAKAYGVPAKEGEPLDELINVRTLFFSEGGGTILLEYDLV